MSTTNLFVELIVIGVGAMAWVVLLVLAFFGWDSIAWLRPNDAAAAIPLLAVTYLLGIVTDRLADALFEDVRRIAARRHLEPPSTTGSGAGRLVDLAVATRKPTAYDEATDAYHSARHTLLQGERFIPILEYGRSRLRICRGWVFNALVLAVAVNVFLRKRVYGPLNPDVDHVALKSTVALLLLAAAAWYAWRRLDETDRLKTVQHAELLRAGGK
ncbi:MAG TPA: hypothetical protein VFE05_07070 [Longimicrobiaceae bacterium]|nr:hypothetical protein [Longimicrobiaceae bacterium]